MTTGRISLLVGPLVLTGLLAASDPAKADPLTAGSDCGGDAFSSAEVVEHRPPRRGPITAMADTLCADVSPQQPPVRVDIQAIPIIPLENGARGGRAPYVGRPPNSGPPRP